MSKIIIAPLRLPDIYFASLFEVVMVNLVQQEPKLDSLFERMLLVVPQIITSLGLRRMNPHDDSTCTCHIVTVPLYEDEIKILLNLYAPTTQMGELLQRAADTINVYNIAEEVENDMQGGSDGP